MYIQQMYKDPKILIPQINKIIKMYTQDQLSKIVFFDLETASEYRSLDDLHAVNPKMADLWSKRCEYLRGRYPEYLEKTDEQLYEDRAALHPEFNRIVCASFGRLAYDGSIPSMVIKSYTSDDEVDILNGINNVFTKFNKMKFCGHNIKRFDVPVMCKRTLINGLQLPQYLMVHDMKPWEMPFIDTSDVWSFGAWQEGYASLELLTTSLGIDSPKDDIRGEEVSGVYWNESDLDRIARYCEKDVYALAQVLLKWSGQNQLTGYEGRQ